MKAWILGIVLVLSAAGLQAQHCPFDHAHIFVLKVMDAEYQKPIRNLEVYFLDSLNQVVLGDFWRQGKWQKDTIFMWPNPDSSYHSGIVDNNHPLNPWQINFWFAERNYVYVGGYRLPGAKIVVVDKDGLAEGGQYPTTVFEIDPSATYPLCTGQSNWNWSAEPSFVPEFKPWVVWL